MPKGLTHRVGAAHRAPGVPAPLGVQGIASNLDDLTLRGEKWKAAIGDALAEGTLIRKIVGASELNIDVHDPKRKLLRSQLMREEHEVSLDGMPFRFVKAVSEGRMDPLAPTYEPRLVTEMRKIKGPHKAFRDKQTRAEFIQRRAFELRPHPVFVCPELHVEQPIESTEDARRRKERTDPERKKGIGEDHPILLKVKGERASGPQRELGEEALEIAESHSAPDRVMIALIAALITESEMGRSSSNVLQGTGGLAAGAVHEIVGFLTGKDWTATPGGAIGYLKRNPEAKAYEIAQAVQASGAGLASNGADNYGKVIDESVEWVEAFGGAGKSTIEFVRYAFKQGKKESNWTVSNRLAAQVNWRFFESVGSLYLMTDDDLLKSRVRFGVSDSTPGVVDTSFDLDLGKESDEMTVEAYARNWAAPPGSVVNVDRHGPADGLWLVERIESPLAHRNSLCKIDLKRPTEPKEEPVPKSKSVQLGGKGRFGGSGAPSSVEAMISKIEEFDAASTEYLWGGGHASIASPSERVDCTGFVSAVLHAGGLLDSPLASPAMMSLFHSGEGEWLTIYANAEHAFGRIKTASGWRTFQTSTTNPGGGPGWTPDRDTSGFTARHPEGL